MNEELAHSSFGSHVAGSDVTPGLTFNTRQGRQNCVDLPELAQPHTSANGDMCRHCQMMLQHCHHVAETSVASFTADVALAGCLCHVRACCRGGNGGTGQGVVDGMLWMVCAGGRVVFVVKVVCCCQSCLLLSELFVVIYMSCVLYIIYTAKRPVATGLDRSFSVFYFS
jgi:hypothetical protein